MHAFARHLERAEALLLVLHVIELPLARAIQTPTLDELHDRVELAGVQKCAVPLADVDDRARQSREIQPVHELSARDAWPVADRRRRVAPDRVLRL